MAYPELMHVALDATDCRGLAEFYRELLGLQYRPGDEPGVVPEPADWLVLLDDGGRRVLAVNAVDDLRPATWPLDDVPKQMHLDFRVGDVDDLERHRRRALDLGAELLLDRSDDEEEPTYVLADPAGHPFCLLVQP